MRFLEEFNRWTSIHLIGTYTYTIGLEFQDTFEWILLDILSFCYTHSCLLTQYKSEKFFLGSTHNRERKSFKCPWNQNRPNLSSSPPMTGICALIRRNHHLRWIRNHLLMRSVSPNFYLYASQGDDEFDLINEKVCETKGETESRRRRRRSRHILYGSFSPFE